MRIEQKTKELEEMKEMKGKMKMFEGLRKELLGKMNELEAKYMRTKQVFS